MLNRIDLRGQQLSTAQLRRIVPRGGADVESVMATVRPIVEDVAARGAEAALSYGEKFDGIRPDRVRVPAQAIATALESLPAQVRAALEEAIRRARKVHKDQKRVDTSTEVSPGGIVTERWIPVDRVGLYVPGGKAVYPSSVVMNVVPAQEAGVRSLVVASPPQLDNAGLPHSTILAACALLGVDEVWAVGGAQAVALMAYGGVEPRTTSNDRSDDSGTSGAELVPVDMITGPGNIFVTAAKRLCRSLVGIDSEAGPTEIAILADETANPVHVAADMISQAEHDPMAAAVLVTTSTELADNVDSQLPGQIERARHSERIEQALSGQQSAIVVVDDLNQGLDVANAYAAEHLEIHTRNAADDARRITSAGAVFVGTYSPVSLGDYAAGSNHVLPTAGSARYSSGLSVQTFLKGVHVVHYDSAALREVSEHVQILAEDENLPAHGEAVRLRFAEEDV